MEFPTLKEFEEWLSRQSKDRTFVRAHASECPVACFLKEKFDLADVQVLGSVFIPSPSADVEADVEKVEAPYWVRDYVDAFDAKEDDTMKSALAALEGVKSA